MFQFNTCVALTLLSAAATTGTIEAFAPTLFGVRTSSSLASTDERRTAYNVMSPTSSTSAFQQHFSPLKQSGTSLYLAGRRPENDNCLSTVDEWQPTACNPDEARLIVVQITDVYTLENFASLQSMISDIKDKSPGAKVISMLTGDFLAPYLLSSVDRGAGMMKALASTPIDYVCWGNHEADIPHNIVCRHVKDYPGTWLNGNMLDHDAMEYQKEFDIVNVESPNGQNQRQLGLVSVLSDDPKLYSHFPSPGAFGGATITDPWDALRKYQALLEGPEHNVDMILPLQHLYVPDDHKTCRDFDFPVILSGHDHHLVDEIVEGTRLLKPGMDALHATVLEMTWPDASTPGKEPEIHATFLKTADYQPSEELMEETERAYDILAPLRNTQLAEVPPNFEPLSSSNARGEVCTMGQYICNLLRSSLNSQYSKTDTDLTEFETHSIDAVAIMGGNIRGGTEYPVGSFFSLEALEAEIKADEVIGVVQMPGHVFAKGIEQTHAGDPIPGWMQYDVGVMEETMEDGTKKITQVRGRPLIPDQMYRIATKIGDLTNGQAPAWKEYFEAHPESLPPQGSYVNVHAELMNYFARILWRGIWESISRELEQKCEEDENYDAEEDACEIMYDPRARLDILDNDNDGVISVSDIQYALETVLGLSVHDDERMLARFVHSYADTNGDGKVSIYDLRLFSDEMGEVYQNDDTWRQELPQREIPTEPTSVSEVEPEEALV